MKLKTLRQMHISKKKLAFIAHEYYQVLSWDYEFSRIYGKFPAKFYAFFGLYADTKLGKYRNFGWDISVVSHAVIIGLIKVLIREAENTFRLEN